MTKPELIKQAYGRYWEVVQEFVNMDDGQCHTSFWLNDKEIFDFRKLPRSEKSQFIFYGQNGYVIPSVILGIKNNNGWIKIERESDLPTSGEFRVFPFGRIENNIFSANGVKITFRSGRITHYRPVDTITYPLY